MLALLERMKRDDITVHGFRSTFRDWAAEETNFPNHVVEMAMAHTIKSKVEGAYRRGRIAGEKACPDDRLGGLLRQGPLLGNIARSKRIDTFSGSKTALNGPIVDTGDASSRGSWYGETRHQFRRRSQASDS